MNPIAIRLLSQQLVCPQFDTPQKVVSHFGAMQAQDYRMVRWAVMMRTRKPSSIAFKKHSMMVRSFVFTCCVAPGNWFQMKTIGGCWI